MLFDNKWRTAPWEIERLKDLLSQMGHEDDVREQWLEELTSWEGRAESRAKKREAHKDWRMHVYRKHQWIFLDLIVSTLW